MNLVKKSQDLSVRAVTHIHITFAPVSHFLIISALYKRHHYNALIRALNQRQLSIAHVRDLYEKTYLDNVKDQFIE